MTQNEKLYLGIGVAIGMCAGVGLCERLVTRMDKELKRERTVGKLSRDFGVSALRGIRKEPFDAEEFMKDLEERLDFMTIALEEV